MSACNIDIVQSMIQVILVLLVAEHCRPPPLWLIVEATAQCIAKFSFPIAVGLRIQYPPKCTVHSISGIFFREISASWDRAWVDEASQVLSVTVQAENGREMRRCAPLCPLTPLKPLMPLKAT